MLEDAKDTTFIVLQSNKHHELVIVQLSQLSRVRSMVEYRSWL